MGTQADIHDFQALSGGNALIGAYPPRPGTLDLSAYGGPATGGTLIDGEIQEIKPDGTKVWSWSTEGHIDPSETPAYWRTAFVYSLPTHLTDGRDAFDWAHMNSFQQVGNTVVVSFRHLDAVYAISKSTGEIIWKLGGTHTDKSLTVVGDPESNPLGGQHFARVLSDGTLTIHDNNTDSGTPPRAIRYRLDLFNRTATLIDSVTDPDVPSSPCCGSADPPGRRLVDHELGRHPGHQRVRADGQPALRAGLQAGEQRRVLLPRRPDHRLQPDDRRPTRRDGRDAVSRPGGP